MSATLSSKEKVVSGQCSKEKAIGKLKKLGVRRPFVAPGPTTRLSAAKNLVGPTTRRTTPTKRLTPKKTK